MPVRVGAAAAEHRGGLHASAVLLYPDAGRGAAGFAGGEAGS